MPLFALKLFGGAALEGPGGVLTGRAAQRQRLALLAVVACAGSGGTTRDRLIGLLWPEVEAERGRHLLSNSLYVLRQALGEAALVAGPDVVRLDFDQVRCDVREFEAALAGGRAEEAVARYAGPLLEGFFLADAPEFERWVDAERRRLAGAHARALESLAEAAEGVRDHAHAVTWWKARAAVDPCDSRVALRVMRALDASGNAAGALQFASLHRRLLDAELGVAPPAEVEAFAARLRDRPPAPAPQAEPVPADVPVPTSVAGPPAEAVAPPARRGRRGLLRIAAALALLATAGGGVLAARSRAADPQRSLVVLPFVNMSADRDNEYFADGLTEEVITRLAEVPELKVISRTSAMHYKGRSVPLHQIARQLGVAHVVEGSVRHSEGRLRVTAQLIDARTDGHRWAETFDVEPRDVFRVQERIARAIVRALEVKLGERGERRIAPGGTLDPEAYDLYLRGLYLRNSLQADRLRQAAEFFDRAIALEPRFALAWAAKASVLAPMAYFGYANRDSIVAQMRTLTARALALDPNGGEAHTALGVLQLFFEWDWAGAEAALRRAVALNPNDAHAWHHLANCYSATSRPREAAAARSRALQLDPLNARTLIVGSHDLLTTGDTAGALARARRAQRLDPSHPLLLGLGPSPPAGLPHILMSQDRHTEAVDEYLRIATLRGATPQEVDAIRAAYASSGVAGFWTQWLAMDRRQSPTPDPMRMASLHALSGDTTRALDWLDRALRERNPGLIYLRSERSLAPLRAHARFGRIARVMGLQ